jgi:hypothetical protein
MSKEEKNKEAKLLNEKQIEIVKKIKNSWNLEEVYRSLNNTITEYFNRYKNYN